MASHPRSPRSDALPATFVGVVWLAMLVAAWIYVARWASPMPFFDDLEMAAQYTGEMPVTWRWLWSLHNEHRIPLPRLAFLALTWAFGDFRAVMYADVLGLGALSAAMVWVARRLRGRTEYADAFFPLLWLSWSNYENLLMAFQVSLLLPAALFSAAFLYVLVAGRPLGRRAALVVGSCALALPLCGGSGWVYAAGVAGWLALAAWHARRAGERSGAAWLGGFAAATVVLLGLYLVGYESATVHPHIPGLDDKLITAGQFLTMGLGPVVARGYWPVSLGVTLALTAGALLVSARGWAGARDERPRALALAAMVGGVLALALAIGHGRAGSGSEAGFVVRYGMLPYPLWSAIYLAFCTYGPGEARRLVTFVLHALAFACVLVNAPAAIRYGERRSDLTAEILREVKAGAPTELLARCYADNVYPNEIAFRDRLRILRRRGWAPYERPLPDEPDSDVPAHPFEVMRTRPTSVASSRATALRRTDAGWVLVVPPEGELRFDLEPAETARELRAVIGILPIAVSERRTDGVRFSVELVGPDGAVRTLYEHTLEPVTRPADDGPQRIAVPLPPDGDGALVLRTSNEPGRHDRQDWSYWTQVEIR